MSEKLYSREEVISLLDVVYKEACKYKKTTVKGRTDVYDGGLRVTKCFSSTGVTIDSLRMVIDRTKYQVKNKE